MKTIEWHRRIILLLKSTVWVSIHCSNSAQERGHGSVVARATHAHARGARVRGDVNGSGAERSAAAGSAVRSVHDGRRALSLSRQKEHLKNAIETHMWLWRLEPKQPWCPQLPPVPPRAQRAHGDAFTPSRNFTPL